ncbi:MAG: FtsW/RodA/SpoVE family cell cycle protein, partial [Trebonia sp.]
MSSAGLPSRGWAGPRAGAFARRRRSPLARAFAKNGVARSWDWPLTGATCALSAFGAVLVWAATEPSLRQSGLDPHAYLEKAALWAVLGVILMFITASIDYRRIRRLTPALYGLSLLLLLAVLVVGQSVNGAKAWISVGGGFQIEPSEFAKLGIVLSTAWLLSRR